LGSRLVEACVAEARQLGVARLMSLTYEKHFFERLGFTVVDRHTLPHKVWSQCIHCAKHDACDEIAMIRVVEGVEEVQAPIPDAAYHEEDIPVPITIGTRQVDGPRRKMSELRE
jgi:amino-acid N-acetyltransferase